MSDPSKNELQEYSVYEGWAMPSYSVSRSGPAHSPTFISTVEIPGIGKWTGTASGTKRGADKSAASRALEALRGEPEFPSKSDVSGKGNELAQNSLEQEPDLVRALYSFANLIPRGSHVDSSDISDRAKTLIGEFEEGVLRRLLTAGKNAGVIYHPDEHPFKWARSANVPTYEVSRSHLQKAFEQSVFLEALAEKTRGSASNIIDELRTIRRVEEAREPHGPGIFTDKPDGWLHPLSDGITRSEDGVEFLLLRGNDKTPEGPRTIESPRSRNLLYLHKELGNSMLERLEKGKRTEALVLIILAYVGQSGEWKDLDGVRMQAIMVNPYSRSRDVRQIATLLQKAGLVETSPAGNSLFAKPTTEGLQFLKIFETLITGEWDAKDDQ